MRRVFPFVLIATLGCVDNPGAEPDAGPTVDAGPQFDPEACAEFVVPQRLGLSWDRLNHRMSTWSVRTSKEDCKADELLVTHIGGNFSTGALAEDAPSVHFSWQDVATNRREVGVARVTLEGVVGPDGEVVVSETFSRAELALRHYPKVVALIDGLRYETAVEQSDPDYPSGYDPAHGYTIRAFGAAVRVVEAGADDLDVDATFRFDPANSPDRPPLNAAIPHAEVGASLDVLIVGLNDVPVRHGTVEYSMAYPEPEPLEDQDVPPPEPDKTALQLKGVAERPRGFWGMSSFLFEYAFDGSCEVDRDCAWFAQETCDGDGYCSNGREEPGEYLREITVGADIETFDAGSGDASFHFVGYTSNASTFVANFALRYDFSGGLTWVQAGDASDPASLDEQFQTGSATFDLR